MNNVQPTNTRGAGSPTDPLIDEVRAIRRTICDEFGNDVEKLAEHLREVEAEYRNRTGRFAGVPREVRGELFSDPATGEADPFISELRQIHEADKPPQGALPRPANQ